MKNNNLKKPLTSYLKLLRHFIKTDTFNGSALYSPFEMVYNTNNHFCSPRVQIHREYCSINNNKKSYIDEIKYGTGRINFNKNYCTINCNIFSKGVYMLTISTNIESKDEFFNFIIQNNTDYLTYEDYKVLKEIKQLTIQLIEGK